MIVVIILWKILPGKENAFLDYWAQALQFDRSHLVGEYLSRPLTQQEVGFDCSFLGINAGYNYVPFFNVGVWESLDAFHEQIIKPFVEQAPTTHDFEYAPRERMVLSPELWRVGAAKLPGHDRLAAG